MNEAAHQLRPYAGEPTDPEQGSHRGVSDRVDIPRRFRFVGPSHPEGMARPGSPVTEAEIIEFLEAVTGPDEDAASQWCASARQRGLAIDDLYLDVLGPAAGLLGEAWADDTLDFVDVTVAMGRLQRLVRELSPAFLAAAPAADPIGRVLLTTPPTMQHTLGLAIVAEFFARDGWDVTFAPPGTVEELVALVRHHHYDVVGLSVSCESSMREVFRTIKALRRGTRNERLQVMVGGCLFLHSPELARTVGADACVLDVRQAGAEARRLLLTARHDS